MDADARKELVDEEHRRCVTAIEAMLYPESGPEYGMASDQERGQMRSHNSTLRCAISAVLNLGGTCP